MDCKALLEARTADGNRRVRTLISDVVNQSTLPTSAVDNRPYLVRVFSGSRGGPTGMCVAVSYPDKGKELAWEVGKILEEVR